MRVYQVLLEPQVFLCDPLLFFDLGIIFDDSVVALELVAYNLLMVWLAAVLGIDNNESLVNVEIFVSYLLTIYWIGVIFGDHYIGFCSVNCF